MVWRIEYTKEAFKQLRKMDPSDSRRIRDWMRKNEVFRVMHRSEVYRR